MPLQDKKEDSQIGFGANACYAADTQTINTQLLESQKMQSIGQLASGIAHEINTPLQYVGDNVYFLDNAFHDIIQLLEKYDRFIKAHRSSESTKELVEEIDGMVRNADLNFLRTEIPAAIRQTHEGLNHVSEIVRALKEFSHPGLKEKTLVDIRQAILSTITIARNEWKYMAEMVTNFDETLPPVPCLACDFNQVILNIIINAVHAIKDVVGEETEQKGIIKISTIRAGNWAEIRISDTGPGIPAEIRSRIFEPFFTTKEVGRGTGQGLSIAYSVVVNKHGGTIGFQTDIGKGTTFIIRIPIISQIS